MRRALRALFPFFLVILFVASVRAEEPIKVGVVYAFTGLGKQWSDYGRMGLELARDEINAAGGVAGRKIELIFEDSQTEPAKAVSAYRKLVSVDRVKYVLGNVWSFITNPLIPLAGRDKVILISPTVMPESIERTNPYYFTMGYKVSGLRSAVDTFFKHWDQLEVRRKKTGTHVEPYGVAPYYVIFAHAYAAQAIEMLADSAARTAARSRLYALLDEIEEPEGGWNDRVFPRSRAFGTAMIVMALLQPQAPARPVWAAAEEPTETKGK